MFEQLPPPESMYMVRRVDADPKDAWIPLSTPQVEQFQRNPRHVVVEYKPAGDEDGAALIAAERRRQSSCEGYDTKHDDEHLEADLAAAAIAYAIHGYRRGAGDDCGWDERALESASLEDWWPWCATEFKPTGDPIRDLTKAGALIAAEIDRLLRLPTQPHGSQGTEES
ncbi:MAG TPA: hypothetical protein VMS60_15760 [Solirubrobacterales bacterium]|nr:hypothetical protein [Solirubrobacterales bacterium]